MARPLRFVYPGACYHLMARGDGGKIIFIEKEDHLSFLHGLGSVCGSHGWRVHAWVLMGNHFHLLLETPEANLVSGMRLLLGSFGQGWNRRHQRRGHVFQGRYKSIPVTGSGRRTRFNSGWWRITSILIQPGQALRGRGQSSHGNIFLLIRRRCC
jgi:putative transposase